MLSGLALRASAVVSRHTTSAYQVDNMTCLFYHLPTIAGWGLWCTNEVLGHVCFNLFVETCQAVHVTGKYLRQDLFTSHVPGRCQVDPESL
jgi:hypothetical protein